MKNFKMRVMAILLAVSLLISFAVLASAASYISKSTFSGLPVTAVLLSRSHHIWIQKVLVTFPKMGFITQTAMLIHSIVVLVAIFLFRVSIPITPV